MTTQATGPVKTDAQTGVSHSAAFEDNTWTFEMPDGYWVAAGEFVIMPVEAYNALIASLNTVK